MFHGWLGHPNHPLLWHQRRGLIPTKHSYCYTMRQQNSIHGHYQFSSVQSHLTLCNPMDCSTPGFPVHHQLSELAQTHIHEVGDAIQPSHPVVPFFLLPSIFLSIKVFSNESFQCFSWTVDLCHGGDSGCFSELLPSP